MAPEDVIHRSNRVAVYPGSFDPLTNGHLDIISRGCGLFNKVIVAVLINSQKEPLFTTAERLAMIRETTVHLSNVEVDSFNGLLVHYLEQRKADIVLRGIRAISDYETELQMALLNRRIRPQTETVFLMASEENSFISSRMVKEIFRLGGNVQSFVPEIVAQYLTRKPLHVKVDS